MPLGVGLFLTGHPRYDERVLEVAHVRKHYRGALALDDVSFHLNPGEMALVTGPSGAGKTTLMRLLQLAERPDAGQITVAGREVTHLRKSSLPFLRRNIGVVFQDFKLLRHLSALANVRVALDILGLPRREVEYRAREALEQVGLATRESTPAAQLSGGEQQRVALARALVGRPAILLCDEPTGNLDGATARGILELVGRAHDAGATIVVATHDPTVIDFCTLRNARRLSLAAGRLTTQVQLTALPTMTGPLPPAIPPVLPIVEERPGSQATKGQGKGARD
jgi:cell division transport system ATP-binding protein